MTYQEITQAIKTLINNESNETISMYTEIVDENSNSTYYTFDGLVEDVIDAIEEEGHESNDYSEYNTLNKTTLENIFHQVK